MTTSADTSVPRLTELTHGGGCGCKLSPAVLREILAATPAAAAFPQLLVGTETGDDAAVWKLNDEQALVATTDFFMPVVDDPFDFGRIAATNALSDIYAMGGRPILALAVVGMPVARMRTGDIAAILQGGAAVCAKAAIPIAGGHSIDSAEPIYGLVALGLVHPDRVRRNSGGRPGDALILTKPLGVGVLSAALRRGELDDDGYRDLIETTTQLNAIGSDLAEREDVHAMTDVTGFGLLGHLLEVCRGAQLAAELDGADVPLIAGAGDLAARGIVTGASGRNWASYEGNVGMVGPTPKGRQALLCDPQTSGGLLLSVASGAAHDVIHAVRAAGFAQAAIVGRLAPGAPRVEVRWTPAP